MHGPRFIKIRMSTPFKVKYYDYIVKLKKSNVINIKIQNKDEFLFFFLVNYEFFVIGK